MLATSRELICLLSFTCSLIIWFLFGEVSSSSWCFILLWHSLGLLYNYSVRLQCVRRVLCSLFSLIFYSGIWVHIEGANTPMFNSSGHVTGLDPNITRDMVDFVQQAQRRNILVTFTLWNCADKKKEGTFHLL